MPPARLVVVTRRQRYNILINDGAQRSRRGAQTPGSIPLHLPLAWPGLSSRRVARYAATDPYLGLRKATHNWRNGAPRLSLCARDQMPRASGAIAGRRGVRDNACAAHWVRRARERRAFIMINYYRPWQR